MLQIRLFIVCFAISVVSCGSFAADSCQKIETCPLQAKNSKSLSIVTEGEKLIIKSGCQDLVSYQKQPMSNPKGGDKFKGSNFIHPLKTPSGFCLTDLQPGDHLHHFGLWWPWKYLKAEGRKVLYWELQKGEGVIEAKSIKKTAIKKDSAEFIAESHYIDKTAPDGPKVILKERLNAKISLIVNSPATGYFLDLTITQTPAINTPVEIVKYRYSGFSIRGTDQWDKTNSKLLTDEEKNRQSSNFTNAKWVIAEGDTKQNAKAGLLMMSHPENYDTPQKLRTWNEKMYNGRTFVNFNPVQESSWILEPGKEYVQKYKLFVYDGSLSKEQADKLWADYAGNTK